MACGDSHFGLVEDMCFQRQFNRIDLSYGEVLIHEGGEWNSGCMKLKVEFEK